MKPGPWSGLDHVWIQSEDQRSPGAELKVQRSEWLVGGSVQSLKLLLASSRTKLTLLYIVTSSASATFPAHSPLVDTEEWRPLVRSCGTIMPTFAPQWPARAADPKSWLMMEPSMQRSHLPCGRLRTEQRSWSCRSKTKIKHTQQQLLLLLRFRAAAAVSCSPKSWIFHRARIE